MPKGAQSNSPDLKFFFFVYVTCRGNIIIKCYSTNIASVHHVEIPKISLNACLVVETDIMCNNCTACCMYTVELA